MNLVQALKNDQQFTPNEKRIAEYILSNPLATSQFNLADLATKTYTSHSAIVRFTQKIGYEGFRDFRVALIAYAQQDRFKDGGVDANFPFVPEDSTNDIADKMASLTKQTVEAMQANFDAESFEVCVKCLLAARRIFIFAKGDTQISARSFQNKLAKLGIFIMIAEEYADEAWVASNISAEDCAIFTSYRADSIKYQHFIHILNDANVPTILISSLDARALAGTTDHWLTTVDLERSDSLKIGTFSSQIAIEYIFNVLYAMIYMTNYHQNNEEIARKFTRISKGALDD
ncbi:MurR/RpiR family transcriptional regulator [Aerococcaceae bacterium 50-4]